VPLLIHLWKLKIEAGMRSYPRYDRFMLRYAWLMHMAMVLITVLTLADTRSSGVCLPGMVPLRRSVAVICVYSAIRRSTLDGGSELAEIPGLYWAHDGASLTITD
jgi:hypothetical protein